MDKGEFLRVLRERLSGEIPEYKVQEHIRYYDHYLSEEIRSGKTEKEAIEALGSPYLIAKTILDMEEQEEPQEDEPEEGETFSYYYKEDEQPQTGYRRKEKSDEYLERKNHRSGGDLCHCDAAHHRLCARRFSSRHTCPLSVSCFSDRLSDLPVSKRKKQLLKTTMQDSRTRVLFFLMVFRRDK